MKTLTTLPLLPPGCQWRRALIVFPRLAAWYIAPIIAMHRTSTQVGTPQPGDLVAVGPDTYLYLPEPAELVEARAVLIQAGLLAPGESVGAAIRRLVPHA